MLEGRRLSSRQSSSYPQVESHPTLPLCLPSHSDEDTVLAPHTHTHTIPSLTLLLLRVPQVLRLPALHLSWAHGLMAHGPILRTS